MPINQTISAIPAAPNRATDTPATFSTKADAFASGLVTLQSQLNTYAGQANDTQAQISASEVASVSASTAAIGAANFVGTWSSVMSYTVGQSVLHNGIIYLALQNNTNINPGNNPQTWRIFADLFLARQQALALSL